MNAPWTEDTIQGVLTANRLRMDDGCFLTLLDAAGNETSFTYDDLMRRAELWAATLHRRDIAAGERVVVILPHGLDVYAAYLGAILLGAVPSMFAHPSPKLSEEIYFETIETLLQGSGAKGLITYDSLRDQLATIIADLPVVMTLCDTEIGEDRHYPQPVIDPEAPAFLQYSSGTTGLKKGVTISHRALLWQVRTYASAIGANEEDTIVSWLPLYHDMGLIACLFLPVIQRCRLVAMSPFDWVKRPALWPEAVSRHRGTLSWLPNFAYAFMARNVPQGDYDLSSLRGVVNCSEPLTDAAHRAFCERFRPAGFREDALAASYAMAETTFAATSGGFDSPLATLERDGRTLVSSGAVLPETEITIRDDSGNPLPDGETGEIEISSPSLFRAYDGNRAATECALIDGRYISGDLGFLHDGQLFVTGRKRDLIIIGGKNIYPHDIEAETEQVAGILPGRTVALGQDDAASGTQRLIILAESDQAEATWPALQDAIRQRITAATEIVPGDVRIVSSRWLRKSTSGKIARAANLARYEAICSPAPVNLASAGCNEVRDLVGGLVAGGAALDSHESLIRSGRIDSFSTVNLILGLEERFGVHIPEAIVSNPEALDSIAAITRTIEQLKERPEDASLPEQDFGAIPLRTDPDRPVALPSSRPGFWTWYYRMVFRAKGISYGKGLRVLGPLLLRLDGAATNISFGKAVTLMPWADLKIRENGRIRIGDGCAIDTTARLVAANDAEIRLGDRAQIAFASIINAGENVTIGRDTATAGHCTIIASEHHYHGPEPIMSQGYRHEPVEIGADVWLASNVLVTPGSRIGNGAVISARSTVNGSIRPYALAAGVPARVIGSRTRPGSD